MDIAQGHDPSTDAAGSPSSDRPCYRVLLIAASVHPDKGSEPGLGWGWIRTLGRYHALHVITGEKEGNREAIASRLEADPQLESRIVVHFVPRPGPGFWQRIYPPLYYRRYRQWHQRAFALAADLHDDISFDLCHQLNMTGFREPGFLWKLPVPFVWGPVGGITNVPLRFAAVLGPRFFIYHLAKVTTNTLQFRYQKRVSRAIERCEVLVVSNSEGQAAFRERKTRDSIVISDTGPSEAPNRSPRRCSNSRSGELRISWAGFMVTRKAVPLLLNALKRIDQSIKWHLDVMGDGPQRAAWQRKARRLGIAEKLTWHGWLPRERVAELIASSDVFAFPSLHEGMPTVVLEALSLGVPVVCLNICGQGDAVTQDCGIAIPVTTPSRVISDFAQAIERLAADQGLRENLSDGALTRVEDFSWEERGRQMDEVYRRVVLSWRDKQSGQTSGITREGGCSR